MELAFFDQQIDRKFEIELLLNNFRNRVGFLEPYTSDALKGRFRDFNNREELLFYCPYWLTEICKTKFPISQIRRTILANLLGAVYITIQDKLIDNQQIMGGDFYTLSLKSNLIFLESTAEFNDVYYQHPLFRKYLRKYFDEFTYATIYEKENHWEKYTDFKEENMFYLGQKFAPVKIACAGTLILGKCIDNISTIEDILDDYYTGYQMIDDIEDWKEDFELKNYTYFLNQLNKKIKLNNNNIKGLDESDLFKSTLINVVQVSEYYFQKALKKSENIRLSQLSDHIKRKIEQVNARYGKEKPDSSNSVYYIPQNVLQIEKKNKSFIYNAHNKAFARVDSVTRRILKSFNNGASMLQVLAEKNSIKKEKLENITASLINYRFIVENEKSKINVKPRILQKGNVHPIMRLEIELSEINIQNIHDYLKIFFQSFSGSIQREIVFVYRKKLDINIIDIVTDISRMSKILNQTVKIHLFIEREIVSNNLEDYLKCEDIFSISILPDTDTVETQLNNELQGKLKYILSKNSQISFKSDNGKNYILPCSFNLQEAHYLKHRMGSELSYFNLDYYQEIERRLKLRTVNCNAGISSLYIAEDGKIAPCFWHKDKVLLKDLFTFNSVKKMQFEYYNKKMENKCHKCSVSILCHGGCLFEEVTDEFCNSQIEDFKKVIIEKNIN